MDQDLRNVLESAKWDQMNVTEQMDATTSVSLSSREGHFALLTLDWQSKLINKLVSKIEIESFPHQKDESWTLWTQHYYDEEIQKAIERRELKPKVIQNQQLLNGPDKGLYFIAYGKSDKCQQHDTKKEL